jgi:arylsulfatase A-like enzyme
MYSTDFIARRATRFLDRFERRDARPWFMYVAPYAPHHPYPPAPRHAGEVVEPWTGNAAVGELSRTDKPDWVRAQNKTLIEAQSVAIGQRKALKSIDDLVGRVLQRMGRLGEQRRTLAFFLSDNGYMWGEHGLIGKRAPYTQSVKIPLLARWPGHIAPGARSNRLAANIDLVPTILGAARLTPAAMKIDGRSLFSSRQRTHLLLEFFSELNVPNWASMRTTRAQYIEYYGPQGRVTFRELYDLERDPWQLRNRWRQRREFRAGRASRLRAMLSAARHCSGSRCP